jgi:hypothetical protein
MTFPVARQSAFPLSSNLACPYPITQNYAGLNDGSLTLSREDHAAFRLASLSYGGIANENEEGSTLPFGQLRITGTMADGSSVTTSADFPELHWWANGRWMPPLPPLPSPASRSTPAPTWEQRVNA